jgi:hypothetical protein
MPFINTRMPTGYVGNSTRSQELTAEPALMNATTPVTGYGLPVKLSSGAVTGIVNGDTAAAVYGFLLKPGVTAGGSASNEAIGAATPPLTGIVDVMKRGYMLVKVNGAGTPSKGSAVYIRVADPVAGSPIGGIEGAADSSDTIVVTGAYFTGAKDADGLCEIAYNL